MIQRFIFLIFLILTGVLHLEKSSAQEIIRGIYGSPAPLWEKGYSLKDLGINALFVHSGSIDEKMMTRALNEGLKVYAEFPTLNGKNYIEEHPQAWPITANGNNAEPASWFMGVCPTNPEFKSYRLKQLRELLSKYALDGIWMDYVHWHAQFEEPEPILPETCFCNDCISGFERSKDIDVPEGEVPGISGWILDHHEKEWRTWRCEVIVDWAEDIRRVIEEVRPGILLGIYHCPWDDEEFSGARRRILGLDYDMLRDKVDVFSPMVYHGRMGRDPSWVKKNIEWFSDRLEADKYSYPLIWPIVQAHDDPDKITSSDFRKVMEGGLRGKSTGIMMFTSYSMAESEEKIRVMKDLYLSLE